MQNKTDIGSCSSCRRGDECTSCCKTLGGGKLDIFDYLHDIPPLQEDGEEWVEIQFKNTRKGFYLNSLGIDLKKGDLVAVEASPGHDIGNVSLTGKMVRILMRRNGFVPGKTSPLKVFRKAKANDIERYEDAKSREEETMIKSREIAKELGLDMKIGDVEYQGDGLKAIFYYIADQRVDFRQLIKRLAEEFRIRIEMKQIGARQEAGRIGGIGPCGRQLCCSGWMTRFMSVGTGVARIQDLSMNPQKLAGQCAKLKCCLNYEVDVYQEAQEKLPPRDVTLKTGQGDYRLFKSDPLAQLLTYSAIGRKRGHEDFRIITVERAFHIIEMNERGDLPFDLMTDKEDPSTKTHNTNEKDILSSESLTRFDAPRSASKSGKSRDKAARNGGQGGKKKQRNSGGRTRGKAQNDKEGQKG